MGLLHCDLAPAVTSYTGGSDPQVPQPAAQGPLHVALLKGLVSLNVKRASARPGGDAKSDCKQAAGHGVSSSDAVVGIISLPTRTLNVALATWIKFE